MPTKPKRYKREESNISSKGRQLSGLFNIISSNLLLATEVLSSDFKIKAVEELESMSRKARLLAKELLSNKCKLTEKEQIEQILYLKRKMLKLVIGLIEELNSLDANKNSEEKTVADLILARKLLRDSQRGLVTIQD